MSLEVASEISKQIGGKAFMMMGAKNLVGSEDSLTWKMGRGAKGKAGSVTHVTVKLDASDTYTVTTCYVRGTKVSEREAVEGVYFDMLHDVIEGATGMYLKLF